MPASVTITDNSANKARTPKWAIRYGLVNDSQMKRKAAKSQWANRYDERLPESTLVGQELAEGEEGPNYVPYDSNAPKRQNSEGLWDREDEQFYNEGEFYKGALRTLEGYCETRGAPDRPDRPRKLLAYSPLLSSSHNFPLMRTLAYARRRTKPAQLALPRQL